MDETYSVESVDLTCMRCDYSLKTIPIDSACPECGLPVKTTMRGTHICHRDPAWLKTLQRGARLIQWSALGVLSMFLFVPVAMLCSFVEIPGAIVVVGLLSLVLLLGTIGCFCLGYIYLTKREPEPVMPESSDQIRVFARYSLWLALGLTAMMYVCLGMLEEESSGGGLGETTHEWVMGISARGVVFAIMLLCLHLNVLSRQFGLKDIAYRMRVSAYLLLFFVATGVLKVLDLVPGIYAMYLGSIGYLVCLGGLGTFERTLDAMRKAIGESLDVVARPPGEMEEGMRRPGTNDS